MENIVIFPTIIIWPIFFASTSQLIVISTLRWMLQLTMDKECMIGIKVEYVQQRLFILKYEKHYRLHFFLMKIFLTYFISYILDSKTKPPVGTVIAIITTICIEKSIKFIHKIWLHWNKRSFIIDDADRFLYAYRWYGV